MEKVDVALKKSSQSLQEQISSSQGVVENVTAVVNAVIVQIDRAILSIATALEEEKSPTSVAVEELLNLRAGLVSKLVSDQNSIATVAGQKSGIDAALQYMTEFAEKEKEKNAQLERQDQHVQRTKERIESGDLNLDRPRKLGDRPETLKNIRRAQEEIREEEEAASDT